MRNKRLYIFSILLSFLLTACGNYQEIQIKGVDGVKFKGMQDNKLLLSLTLDIENPNRSNLNIKAVEFKGWLGKREFGNVKIDHRIKIKKESRALYEVPLEIQLRTAADALKLMTNKEKLLNQLTVEGYIKGGKFPVVKKIKVEKTPVTELLKKFK